MLLSKMFEDAPDIQIDGFMQNSKNYLENSMFFCINGIEHDGHNYVNQAIKNGAICIVHTKELETYQDDITYIKVKDIKSVLSKAINIFYKNPSENIDLFGVTGTNGKTTICNIITRLLSKSVNTGYMGTLGVFYNDEKLPPLLTTLDIMDNYKLLDKMIKSDVKACAMEVSSIGLVAGRVSKLDYKIAIYSNLTHDHLDYHGDFKSYINAKKILFDNLKEDAFAIMNSDDMYYRDLITDCKSKIVTYGIDSKADFQAFDVKYYKDNTTFNLKVFDKQYYIETNLVAKFNIYNLLASISALYCYGIKIEDLIKELQTIPKIEGRMDIINENQNFNVIVDFAHTPDGLEKVMLYAKKITKKNNRIIAVFGSAGKRDVLKRKIFGQLADKYCDLLILTEDDPRDEDVIEIAEEIATGVANINYLIIENRNLAINQAISLANAEDTVIILGKGNEKFIYREFGKVDYDGDEIIAKNAIIELMK